MRLHVFAILILLSTHGCSPKTSITTEEFRDTAYIPLYANGFEIYSSHGAFSTMIKIKNPWQGAENITQHIFVSRNSEAAPEGFDGVTITAPLERIACMSSSHVAFADMLGKGESISGISGARFITNPDIRSSFELGKIKDIGYEGNVNYEILKAMNPNVVFMYSVAGENTSIANKLQELGIPVIYIGDYLESSPLGKAEWLVLFGELFDHRKHAEHLFTIIRNDYEKVRSMATSVEHRPSVMLNIPWRDTWFVPGDRSYMVRLITDAGGTYACAGDDSDRSRPISSEEAYIVMQKSDYWLNPGQVINMQELKSEAPRFANLPAVTAGKVYNNNLRLNPEGGSDFWEYGVVRPDIVLKDMIGILHPELIPDHKLYFFRKIK